MIGDKLQYALKDNILVSIDQVEKGLACNCICPACKAQLVAKKGEKNKHHFAHHNGSSCATGYQTSLHLLAKDLINEKKMIKIPPVYCEMFREDEKDPKGYTFKKEKISEATLLEDVKVSLEQKDNGIIPDIIVEYKDRKLYVEIYVSHKVDDNKKTIVQNNNVSMMEIDLSDVKRMISKEELSKYLFERTSKSVWIYNAYRNKVKKEQLAKKNEFIKRWKIQKQKEEQERQNKIRSSFEKALCPLCSAPIVKYITQLHEFDYVCSNKDCDISKLLNAEYRSILEKKLAHTKIFDCFKLSMFNGKCPKCRTRNLVIQHGYDGPYVSCEFLQCHPRIYYDCLPKELLRAYWTEKKKYEQEQNTF